MIRSLGRAAAGAVLLLVTLHLPATAQVAGISEDHRAAVVELLEVMRTEQTMQASVGTMMNLMLQQAPQLAEVRSALEAFFAKYFTWDELQEPLVALYATTFAEAEVRDLVAFYRTPTGMKLVEAMPLLTQKSAEIGQQQIQRHLPELQEMLRGLRR
jgi:uncharacterized protein